MDIKQIILWIFAFAMGTSIGFWARGEDLKAFAIIICSYITTVALYTINSI